MRRLCALALLCSVPAVAGARTPEPQQHEVRLDIDLQVESQANGAFVNGTYTFTPGSAINRTDDVVPILRRFVRHPSAIWASIGRNGNTREQITGGRLGGILQLGGGRLYLSGETGIEKDIVTYDPNEDGYWALPVQGELGFRPVELLSVGGFYSLRKILSASIDANRQQQTERSGTEQRFGLTASAATSNDRVYATVSAWLARNDWTFESFHVGDITARGFGASLRVAFQVSSGTTFQIRGLIRSEHWVNARAGEDNTSFVGADLDRDVLFAYANAELIYWFRGRFAFRAGFGGGFEGAPPVINNRETGVFQLGLGLITRF